MPPAARHAALDTGRPGEGMIRAGAVLFAVGVVGVLGVVVPFLLGRDDAPLAWTLVATLLPLGLAVALLGLLRSARAGRRAAG